jgi:hypothetical protein
MVRSRSQISIEKDDELIPADPTDDIIGPDDFTDALGHNRKNFISEEMPIAIVDQAKIIDIQNHQCGLRILILHQTRLKRLSDRLMPIGSGKKIERLAFKIH